MSLSLVVSVLTLSTVYKDSGKKMPSGQRVVVAEGTPVTATKEVATSLSWVLLFKEIDLALRDPSLHYPEVTSLKGVCSVVFIFLSQACFLFSPALSR